MWTVARALLTKPWKNSFNKLRSKSLIDSFVKLTFQLNPGLPEKSTTTLDKASSKGAYAEPNLKIPFLSPKASLNASPRLMHTSSTQW